MGDTNGTLRDEIYSLLHKLLKLLHFLLHIL